MKKQRILKFQVVLIMANVLFFVSACGNTKNTEQETEKEKLADIEVVYEYGIPVDSFNSVEGVVGKGETLSAIFGKMGCNGQVIHQLNDFSSEIFDVKRIKLGDKYTAYYTKDSIPTLTYVVYHQSVVDHVVFQVCDSLSAIRYQKPIRREQKTSHATITTSLWDAIITNNLHRQLALELSDIYAWSIDFFGLQKNDSFTVFYDELYVDSLSIGIGKIHAAKFTHKGKPFLAFYFKNDSVNGFWDEEGNSLRKAFLKAPLKFSRISSGFTYARKHPIYKTVRPHTGVDYAAPTGTPVMSIGDGVVVQKGYKGGGGHTVKIRHNSVYTTAYLHLSRYAKNLKVGSHVSQGEVIGYVGSTGASTGPHLDFRVWKNGSPINPLTMESPSVEPIPQNALEEFFVLRDSLKQTVE
ncbi:MAG: peptidoglycan DD-metalloendopeptidase family protein [Paludibacteraceae bacterium]|nr:peptidoglycan DD-metalloendopeptidase family protein [Paludibacteraceae bacterium]